MVIDRQTIKKISQATILEVAMVVAIPEHKGIQVVGFTRRLAEFSRPKTIFILNKIGI